MAVGRSKSLAKGKAAKAKPAKAAKSAKPAKPASNAKPAKAVKAAKSTKPTKPTKATRPAKPAPPTKPTKPAKPEKANGASKHKVPMAPPSKAHKSNGANGAARTPTTDPPPSKKGAAPIPLPTASGRGGLLLPGWLRPRVEGLTQKCQEVDWEEPGQLAATLLEGIKEIAVEELGDHAAAIGAVKLEPLRPMLAKALGREFDMRESLGGLGKGPVKGWLLKVMMRAIGMRFDEPKAIQAPVLARPLFERAVGEALDRVRGTASDPRTVVRGLIEALDNTAREVGLAELNERIAGARSAPVPFEQAVRRVAQAFQVSGATAAQWAKLGFSDVASRAKSNGEWISVPRAIWATRREDATQVLDRLGQIIGLAWAKTEGQASSSWAQRLGAAGVLRPYAPSEYFSKGDALSHPRFGIGVVTTVEQGRVEVTFPDGVRKLAHAG
ncbi:MAG: hypothetical protein JNL21_39910 [Myxococcales bacterium]|nr:hypothetical protein [Myxococcales bacterium]